VNFDLKTAKIFTWNGRAATLEELRRIKDFYLLGADERRFLTEIIAKFDMISGDIEISKVKKAMNDALDKATCIDKEATITIGNAINFRDWITGRKTALGKNVLINSTDFEFIAQHYNRFVTVEPRITARIAKEKRELEEEKVKTTETTRYTRAQCHDITAYAGVVLSYSQWKRVGRFVKPGEKSTISSMDASGSKYALFYFAQTDVAEERYKSKPEQTKMCACGAQECSTFGCCLDPNS
jgi:hypothetical protein